MNALDLAAYREQLEDRRRRLRLAVDDVGPRPDLAHLLGEVDRALGRVDSGTYGICESCGEPIEADRLVSDPLLRFCLDHLSPGEARALERDLEMAARVQGALLPPRDLRTAGYEVHTRYLPAGPVSGDYCDLVVRPSGDLAFAVGDVAGKGIPASILMGNLHALFRVLTDLDLPVCDVVERANRFFCESTMANHYATLVFGRAAAGGRVELCNAGHVPPVIVRRGEALPLRSSSFPLGMFCSTAYLAQSIELGRGESLVVVTDGVTEAPDPGGDEYGMRRLLSVLRAASGEPAAGLADACLADHQAHRAGRPPVDDVALMVLRRVD